MIKKMIVSLLIFACAPISLARPGKRVDQGSGKADLSGIWVLEKSQNDSGKNTGSQFKSGITLVISQDEQEIKITRKIHENGKESIQELIFYSDSRGETNPTYDGKGALKSNTKWNGNKLIIKFSMPSTTVNRNVIMNERVDEWKLSADSKTLTQASSFTSSPSADASINPYGSPRTPNILTQPLRWREKKVFKRIS